MKAEAFETENVGKAAHKALEKKKGKHEHKKEKSGKCSCGKDMNQDEYEKE